MLPFKFVSKGKINYMAEKKIVETPKFTDGQLDNLAKEAGNEINKQPKVKVRIPVDKLNPKDEAVPVCVNGYTWTIKRGVSVEVPEVVAEILEESGYI